MALVELTPGCRSLRRHLGPMAWVVLEDIALDATPAGGDLVARTSARLVAEHLGIQPGTAARALRRLRDEGLIALGREERAGGRFGLVVYRLADIAGVTVVNDGGPRVGGPHMVSPAVGAPHVALRREVRRDVEQPRAGARGDGRAAVASPPVAQRPPVEPAKPARTAQPSLWEEP